MAYPGIGIYTGQVYYSPRRPRVALRQGRGKFWYVNGDVYEGHWRRNLPHGQGRLIYTSGAVYEGAFVSGRRHGAGVLTYASGDVYEGAWNDDNKEGRGTFTWARNGERYEGEWLAGVMHGEGHYTFADGCTFEGGYCEGKRHGFGVFNHGDGTEESGEWEHGTLVRRAPVDESVHLSLDVLIRGAKQKHSERQHGPTSSKQRSQGGGESSILW